jgi:hypothetical protein
VLEKPVDRETLAAVIAEFQQLPAR